MTTPQRSEIAIHPAELLRLALMRLCLRRPEARALMRAPETFEHAGELWEIGVEEL